MNFAIIGLLIAFSMCYAATAQETSQDIPSGLSAMEYLLLGERNQKLGRPEIARACIKHAILLEPSTEIGKRASLFLQSNIPKYPVPSEAEGANNRGSNFLLTKNLQAAIVVLDHCCQSYPQFEWPFYNLSCAYLTQGNAKLAKTYASKAVAINPSYSNGWLALANVYLMEKDYRMAKDCAQKASQYDPDSISAKKMLTFLQRIVH
jgi:tetratricopeptide (TPR) repeat protein